MDIENEIKKIFFQVFPTMQPQEFDWNKLQKEYENWDSFAHLHILTLTEEKFGISLTIEESTSIDSAKKLLDYVRAHEHNF
jgi:acyl carrier protein